MKKGFVVTVQFRFKPFKVRTSLRYSFFHPDPEDKQQGRVKSGQVWTVATKWPPPPTPRPQVFGNTSLARTLLRQIATIAKRQFNAKVGQRLD